MELHMKKICAFLCFVVFSLCSTSIWADHPWRTNWPENVWLKRWDKNFLLGVFGGYADKDGSTVTRVNYGAFPNLVSADVVRDISDLGVIYGILGGYQGKCDQWLFGGEFSLERHPINDIHQFAFSDPAGLFNWQGSAQYRRDWMTAFTFRGGYQFVDYFMPYVRLGIETGQDIYEVTLASNVPNVPILYPANKKWVWRFLSGAGIEIPVTCTRLALRMEYQFHSKGKTIEVDKIYTDGIINPITNSELQPKTQTFILAIVSNFS